MDPDPLISVVIPVKNGSGWLNETIPAILNQELSGAIEIIAIDSGSTDQTLSILSKYTVHIISIQPEEFNHGLTRNLGVSLAKGKFVVMTVQDAKPVSRFWLQQLLDGFTDDTIAGVCGQQIVPHHFDKNPMEWYRPLSKPELRKYHFPVTEVFKQLSAQKQLDLCRWDDVNAMYRKDLLTLIPFRKTDFAEDALWARDTLMAGYAIVYNPVAQVEHYHQEDFQFAFKRNFIIRYHFYKYFDALPSQSNRFIQFLKTIKRLIKEKDIPIIQKLSWLKYNYRNQRAVANSNDIILKSLRNGKEEQLDDYYRQISKLIPQALKLEKSK
jgi:rhamnosyltransferase